MTPDLFAAPTQSLAEGALLLRGFADSAAPDLLAAVTAIATAAPFRHLVTPGGFRMSVAMTNCGDYGWVSDRSGYRYDPVDPENGRPWPPLPSLFLDLAKSAAAKAGFPDFRSDVCLINRYLPGTRLTLHQDKDEGDFTHPIVSVSLGLPATFLWGGLNRTDKVQRVPLAHGDIVVWGGPSRLRYHGIAPLKPGLHPLLGEQRLNLTFRRAR